MNVKCIFVGGQNQLPKETILRYFLFHIVPYTSSPGFRLQIQIIHLLGPLQLLIVISGAYVHRNDGCISMQSKKESLTCDLKESRFSASLK